MNFSFLSVNIIFIYFFRLETGIFAGRPADYAFMLGFVWLCSTIVALFMNIMVLMDPLVLSVLYVWCQLNKDTIVNFWFGTQFKAMYLPWVLFAFNLIIANGGAMELIGKDTKTLGLKGDFFTNIPQLIRWCVHVKTPV